MKSSRKHVNEHILISQLKSASSKLGLHASVLLPVEFAFSK